MKTSTLKLTFVIMMLCQSLLAQKVKVEDGKDLYEETQHQGQFVLLDLDRKDIGKAWEKYLKNFGKVESSKHMFSVNPATIPACTGTVMLSHVTTSKSGTKVWLCLQTNAQDVTVHNQADYQVARKMLYEFGVTAYKDDINEQIAEAERALEQAVKVQEKKLKEGENFEDKLVENKNDKLDYEIKAKKNAEDFIRLNNAINNNLQEQRAALDQVQKIKADMDKPENQSSQELHKTLNDAIDKQQQKVKEGDRLAKDLEKNKSTKIDLEQKLIRNDQDRRILESSIKQNKADQVAAAADSEKMRKAVEVVKAKLQTIE